MPDCEHKDAVLWNPYNEAFQCHRCGQRFVPQSPAGSPDATASEIEERWCGRGPVDILNDAEEDIHTLLAIIRDMQREAAGEEGS